MSNLLTVQQAGKKRKPILLETKYEIVNKSINGAKTSELAVEYEKSSSTISTILKEKEKIIKEYEENKTADRKRIKLSIFPLLEDAMTTWFKQAISHTNVVIDGPTIQAQASKYANFLSYDKFKASSGWLDGFKKRNNIAFKTSIGEASLVDDNA